MSLSKEWQLFKENIYCLVINKRMGRVPYIFAVLGTIINIYIYLFLIALLGSATSSFFVKILPYLLVIIGMFVIIGSLVRRVNDIGLSRWGIVLVLVISSILKLLFNSYELDVTSIFQIFSIFDITLENLFITLLLLLFSLPLGEENNNNYGYAHGINKFDDYFIAYGNSTLINSGVSKDKESFFDNVYKVYFSKLLYISGRANRGEYIVGVIGANFVVFILIFLITSISKFSIDFFDVSLISGVNFLIVYIWPSIGIITLSIRRLHDCLLSSLWIGGLILPFINLFVIYHLVFKKSWYLTINPNGR